MTGFSMTHQHAVLTVNGHEEFRAGESQHQLLVFLEAMTGNMNAFALAVNHLGSENHQPVDRVHHGNGVPRNGARGENDRVGGLHLHLRVFTPGDPAEGSQTLTLTAGHQQQRLPIGDVVDLLDRHKQLIGSTHVAQLPGLADHIEHRPTEQANLATVLERQFKNHRHPMNRAGEGGDNHPALGTGDMPVKIWKHRAFRRTESRHLRVGGIAEQTENALVAVMGQPLYIEMFTIHRGVVELEIAGENDGSHRSLDGQRVAVGH